MKNIYRISGLMTLIILVHSCKKDTIPILTTSEITSIEAFSATGGGNVIFDGGVKVSERGVCWSKNPDPTIKDDFMYDGFGSGEGIFSCPLTILSGETKYYVRAYATNSIGTGYGNQVSFTTSNIFNHTLNYGSVSDIDNNIYETIQIGTQIWMAEDLKTTKYCNGDLIGTTSPPTLVVANETSPKYQWTFYGNDKYLEIYGRLYTWYAATDSRNVCPDGWRVPADTDWVNLRDFLIKNGYGYNTGGDEIAKSMASLSGWWESDTPGFVGNDQISNNKSGFTAVPGGLRNSYGIFEGDRFQSTYWSATVSGNSWGISYSGSRLNFYCLSNAKRKDYGLSVRCIKN